MKSYALFAAINQTRRLSVFTHLHVFPFIYRSNVSRKRIFVAVFISIIVVVGIITALSFGLKDDNKEPSFKQFHGAVAANGKECAEIGASILRKHGSVADAAIATMLCEGVTCECYMSDVTFEAIFD